MAYVELPFGEDVRQYYFAPLWNEKVTPSDEQLQAVDDLIEALMEKNEPDPDDRLGVISHKKSLITIFVTSMKSKISSKNLIFFIKKISTSFDFGLYLE